MSQYRIYYHDIIRSADVKALYPSISVEDAIDIVADEFENRID